ncbi:tetratricopeptide repeat protein [Thiomicrorhabdus xiamenensis]|uniref:Tetratricopeptide repeat protein n=1 Tax=Thiomicrorhabdus xiamenensis TaxID=2739063 RepID=A0A7D4NQ76_9GAMM|nr:tetratricopeptide repeat protein [Thiomicrorhabdus xiamenensis]QKI88470.1 tetratricopeptide repeat protein [Thiomicrorhabdus xiamenensis]
MPFLRNTLFLLSLFIFSANVQAQLHTKETQDIENLEEPVYNPFIERYVLDELKQLRTDMNDLHVDITKEVVNREMAATTRAVSYATDTITYFFYLIAGVSSVLVLVGWNSLREVKEKVHTLANTKIEEVVSEYEDRLEKLEEELNRKSRGITSAQKRLSQHQDIYSLWLKAGQEQIASNKVEIYDQILERDPENAEALTYKADVVLDMDEPHWAISLCLQALRIDPENSHAMYQLASAYALLGSTETALQYLEKSLNGAEGNADSIYNDSHFESLRNNQRFIELLKFYDSSYQPESD